MKQPGSGRGLGRAIRVALVVSALVVSGVPVVALADDEYEFRGTVESLPATSGWTGEWKVGGRVVRVDAATEVEQKEGPVAVGAYVEVEGALQADGTVTATEIEVERGAGS
jgi:hypothetical protein